MLQWILGCIYLFELTYSFLFRWIPRGGIAEVYNSSIVNFWRNLCTVFQRGCTNSYSHQQSSSFPSSPHPPNACYFLFFNNSHSNRCEVIFHCDFDLHFPIDWWCWTYFHVPFFHMHELPGKKKAIQILCQFLNWIVVFF